MKKQLCLLLSSALLLGYAPGFAQDAPTQPIPPPPGEPAEPAPPVDPADPTVPPPSPDEPLPPAEPGEPLDPGEPADPADPAESDPLDESEPKETEVREVIAVDGLPLPEAISFLARMANINFQFDPRVLQRVPGPDGTLPPYPIVTFKWDNITPLQALTAVLDNHDLQMIEDPRTRTARVTARDPNALEPLISKMVKLQHSQPTTNLVNILRSTVSPRSQIMMDTRTSQLLLIATEQEMLDLESLIARLDIPSQQILIEARILETSKNPRSIKGIDWSDTLADQNFSFGNGITSGTATTITPGPTTTTTLPGGRQVSSTAPHQTTSILNTAIGAGGISADTARGLHPSTAFLNADGVRAVLSFLNSDSDTESIATPRAVALDGQPTELSVVRNIPVFEEEQGALGGAGTIQPNTVKPNYELMVGETILNEVGIKLIVTPRIVGQTNVFLDLRPEVSAVEAVPERKVLGGRVNEAPIFSRRRVTTQAIVPSGNTLVLGGLNSDNTTKTHTKVPILGDIPVLGLAFRRDGKSRLHQNLIMFITPTIVEQADFQPTLTNFLRSRPGEMPEPEESAWDSGKPYDWTKPRIR
jgi:type II secretory pathway component GspD/PulD (secretin)